VSDRIKDEAEQSCDDGSWLFESTKRVDINFGRVLKSDLTSIIMNSVRYGWGRIECIAATGRLSLDMALA